MSDQPVNAKTYNVLPGTSRGMVTPEQLEGIAAAARKHNIPLLKLTSAQRIAIGGHAPETAAAVFQELGQPEGPRKPVGIHYIQACPGSQWCKYGRQDSLALAAKMEAALLAMPLPAKTKVGVSGCSMNCCEGFVRDLGVFGKKNGWTIVFGGNGGGLPRIGDIIAQDLSDEEVVLLAGRCLRHYGANARKLERTARFMERSNLEQFKTTVLAG